MRRTAAMKKRYIFLICIAVLLLSFAVFVAVRMSAEYEKYNISGNVEEVEIHLKENLAFQKLPERITDKDQIAVLLNCIKKAKNNYRYRIRDMEETIIPVYEFTFFFDDGKTKTYTYEVYPSEKYKNPFGDLWDMFPQGE